jgi:hypothetical protein
MGRTLLILGALIVVSLIPVAWSTLRAYLKFRGTRVITCPETGCPAAVEVDERHAASSTFLNETELRLASCSRWPEREGCGQECLAQIEAAPEGCLVRTMLIAWYRGSTCAFCQKEIPEIHWSDHKPAILTPDGRTIEWAEVRPENLPGVFATHRRVCWNCHIAQSFRARFPGLAVERPERPSFKRAS